MVPDFDVCGDKLHGGYEDAGRELGRGNGFPSDKTLCSVTTILLVDMDDNSGCCCNKLASIMNSK